MNLRYDDAHESRAMAQHRARKQAQAGAERSQDDTDRYNGALMRRDPRLVRLLPAPAAAGLLEGPANDPTPDRKARAQLLRIRRLMKVAAGRKEQRRLAELERLALVEADWKRKTNEAVQAELHRQGRSA